MNPGFRYNVSMVREEFKPTVYNEQAFWLQGRLLVAGVDEAGRGAWAGPVAAGAVILPATVDILQELADVCDSKLLTAAQREAARRSIVLKALAWGVGYASSVEIDSLGILPATKLAMCRALAQCCPAPQALVIDAVSLKGLTDLPQQSIIHGDRISLSIAAASILAKTARDYWMMNIDPVFPGYGFAIHKGYGTARHRQHLLELGPCAIHRFSFRPMSTRQPFIKEDSKWQN
jgi:ribonuclease HII